MLNLSGSNIDSEGAVALADAFKCYTILEQLDLDGNDFGSDSAVALADALNFCS